jgi:peptidoglycan/LPS O-acetylase OafA/YrhL
VTMPSSSVDSPATSDSSPPGPPQAESLQPRPTPGETRLPTLDGLRGVAILLVLLSHLTLYSEMSTTTLLELRADYLPPVLGSHLPGALLFGAVGATASVTLALVSWYLLEQPFLRLKRWFAYDQTRPLPVPGPMAEGR